MPKLVIQNLKPYDGEYDLSLSGLTNRDYHRIKQLSGVRAGELEEAMKAGDIGVFVALTEMLLKRNGFPEVNVDALWDAPEECFDVRIAPEDEAVEDAGRPLATADQSGMTGGNEKSSDSPKSEEENIEPSGNSGSTDGENSPLTPLSTGRLGSLTSADFAQSTSAD